ncbi:MAG: glycoside hydrolase domain-containing protein [Paludibacteraceae bacterium]
MAKIMQELYSTSSARYSGNEDFEQMSAWYVLSAVDFIG